MADLLRRRAPDVDRAYEAYLQRWIAALGVEREWEETRRLGTGGRVAVLAYRLGRINA